MGVWRIRDRTTFGVLRRTGSRVKRGPLVVTYAQVEHDNVPRVAYAVGKRVGSAVVRNRLRRRLRASVDSIAASLPGGAYLVAAGPSATKMSFEELTAVVEVSMRAARERHK